MAASALEILKFIQENAGERGITITCYDKNNRFRTETWSVRGNGVDASSYLSLTEAFEVWMPLVKKLQEERYGART